MSTTRPETILGDVAIAVHPDDDRYASMIGKSVNHPFVKSAVLPVVADATVDPGFGTGAVKITPAHDQNDFQLGKRHSLPTVNILAADGTLDLGGLTCTEAGESLHGVPRFLARWRVVKALKDFGLYRGEREHPMTLPVCSRSGDVIEPLIKPQWYVKGSS